MTIRIINIKNIILTCFCFLLQFHLLSGQEYTSRLRIATYNVWNPVFEEKYSDTNTWDSRVNHIIKTIRDVDPDIICLQETGLDSYLDLMSILGREDRYLSYYHPHAKSHTSHIEGRDGLAILIKPNLIENALIHTSNEKLRPTHRRDFWFDIKIPNSEKIIRIATTHLDSSSNLELGNTQLENLVYDITEDVHNTSLIVVCGDFNEGENEALRPRARIMEKFKFITDGSTKSTRPDSLDVRHKGHVDWIYFKKISDSLKFITQEGDSVGDEQGSDHKLTYTDFYFGYE